jgi:hypothetical protein
MIPLKTTVEILYKKFPGRWWNPVSKGSVRKKEQRVNGQWGEGYPNAQSLMNN